MRRILCAMSYEEIMEHHVKRGWDAKEVVIRTYNGGHFSKWAKDFEIRYPRMWTIHVAFLVEDLAEDIQRMT